MKLLDICRKAGALCPKSLENIEILGITSNSKRVKKGYLFFCLKGTKSDGHRYVDEALINGASAVVIENEIYACEKSVKVKSTRKALARMMNVFCGEPTKELKFIGITGTNGKTSTAVMIKHIFDTADIPCELIGTLNCSSFSEKHGDASANFTTPDPEELYPMLRRISDAGIKTVVMEASSHALKLDKLEPIDFEIGIFTNLTEDHLDFHSDMEDYFKSKLRLFERCHLGIINYDDEYGKRIAEYAPCTVKTCSLASQTDNRVLRTVSLGEKGTEYTLSAKDTEMVIRCSVPGNFSVMNSMQACVCALEAKIDKKIIEKAFESFHGVKGRLEKADVPDSDITVFIDYAHTPDALQKLLDTVNSFKEKEQRTVLLFGCGGDREKEKRALMGKIATENADCVIITGDNPRSEEPNGIINDILYGVGDRDNFVVIPNRKEAIEYAVCTRKSKDVILLAGKGHEDYEINADGKHPFDERKILKAAFEKYKNKGN